MIVTREMEFLNWTNLAACALASGIIGVLAGMFGFGGGFLLVPVLNILLGVPIEYAAGASACQVLGPATTSLLARKIQWSSFRLPLILSGGLLVGVNLGARLLAFAREAGDVVVNGRSLSIAELVVLPTYWAVLLLLGIFSLYEAHRSRSNRPVGRGWLMHWRIPPNAPLEEFDGRPTSIPVLAWFGFGVGLLSGLLGNSGGLVLLPGLVYLLGMPTQQAVVSSLVIVWINSILATASHAWLGHVHLGLVAVLLFGGTIGARVGSRFGTRLSGPELRARFGWVVLVTAGLISLRLVSMLLVRM
ncbi:sulfite exporter TauE/SafE family protein [Thalassoroseus pseudoceratinae]|uniref:sulfite exporter TauE/SafE family protein n=1 Tax=Thalassoroseus pseudoceratinae TaxID=2713176 RepID=UPI0014246D8D|nr:sulfite exporter TauE/SafE family protein [Thalassoroseus pseudoceratinae]